MRSLRRSTALALIVLLLAGCSAKTPTPSASSSSTPEPQQTQAPSPAAPSVAVTPTPGPAESSPVPSLPVEESPSPSAPPSPSSSEPPSPTPTESEHPADPGTVLLTFADGTQRTGHSSSDDVTIEIPGKGGARLIFHLSEEELEWAETVEFQKATVQFGGSEWEHPGELIYNKELQALTFIPLSSDSQAYVHYNGEVTAFSLQSEDEANPEVLSYVDQVLEGEEVRLMCWLSNGSGPCTVDLTGYKTKIRLLFAKYDWTPCEENHEYPYDPAQWSIYLNHGTDINLSVSTQADCLTVMVGQEHFNYTAEGCSALPYELAELYPGPHIRFCLAEVPADNVSNDQELAEAYAAAFEEMYLASGHITSFELTGLEPVYYEDTQSIYLFRMAFSVIPADPTAPYWVDFGEEYHFDHQLTMLLDEDNIWRCDWIQ